ncbi:9,9'-di-cis-zeta-carotene desaturase [Acetobacteraceae bacterium EV16G]|uniref:hydroxysqualene dehydroxylase HpnE n=1 Tax=Sorlinia euscelidii TaxID=3081148 RepID=UPI002F3BB3A9
MPVVHVIGGGLAGLSAAVEFIGNANVRVYESARSCGGRARSFYDKALDRRIDNGNHLVLSANRATFRFLGLIGAYDGLTGPGAPIFPWHDVATGESWVLRLNEGRFPFWAFCPSRRVPGMRWRDLAVMLRLLRCQPDDVVTSCLGDDALSRRLLAPFAVSALNTPIDAARALLLKKVVQECLLKGGRACRPFYPKIGLSETFVTPAAAHLTHMRAEVRTGCRVTGLQVQEGRVRALEVGAEVMEVAPDDQVVIATPAPVAAGLLQPSWPELTVPDAFQSIINVHFALPTSATYHGAAGRAGFTGVNGGMTEWIYLKPDLLSVTVSAANRYLSMPQEALTQQIWQEVRQVIQPLTATKLPQDAPQARVIIEKRATFAASVAQDKRRPSTVTPLSNLVLAGDWTQTGLPSTIEGAIRSGVEAARILNQRRMF